MTLLMDIMDVNLLNEMKEQKYVREQVHPEFSRLRILNYTESATWENVWNEVTLQCRGLIYDIETAEVVARPFRKFFNYEQEQAPKWDLGTVLHVTDKMDGSLGILYIQPDGQPAIATRGSFASDQAIWASQLYRERYSSASMNRLAKDYTFLFEIIYPENRIVLDYGDMEDLVLIGVVDIEEGTSVSLDLPVKYGDWTGPVTKVFNHSAPLHEILARPPRENAEGFVLYHEETDERVKIKYDDYKLLHKFLTNTSEKHVWEVLSQGLDIEDTFAGAPDEFHEWLKAVIFELETHYREMEVEAAYYHENILLFDVPKEYTRKEFAEAAQRVPQPYRAMVFLIEDERPFSDLIWKQLKPVGATTFKKVDSDAD
jgi:RNA ligase